MDKHLFLVFENKKASMIVSINKGFLNFRVFLMYIYL